MAKESSSNLDQDSLVYVATEISSDHPTPAFWKQQGDITDEDDSTGYARILINKKTSEIVRMELEVDGVFLTDGGDPDKNILEQNLATRQPFHFHNRSQASPFFFVQQLFDYVNGEVATATLNDTETGFSFTIEEHYTLRNPVNNPSLTKEFVIQEILDGVSYLGLHTRLYEIPVTPLAGQLVALSDGTIDGKIEWLGGEDDVVNGTRKNDLLSLGAGDDKGNGGNGDDVLDGGAGNDKLRGRGGDDTLWGGDGNDHLVGGLGDDVMDGNRGDDKLLGGPGDDQINGGVGSDLLIGGKGNDALTGGADLDVFRFGRKSGNDLITDFAVDEDVIKLAGGQRIKDLSYADLDGAGSFGTLIKLSDGEVSVLNVDLTLATGWII
ncbi:MAG: calcium-binding protein [Cyanobacteria bacterium J06638_7]